MLNAHVCEAKQARALRCYMAMHINGGEETRAHLREVTRLVKIAKQTLEKDPRFEVLETASTTCMIDFRPAGVSNEKTNEFLNLLTGSRDIFIVSTFVNKVEWIRFSVGSYATEEEHIHNALNLISSTADKFLK